MLQRLALPYGFVARDLVEGLRLDHEKAAVHPRTVALRLLMKLRDVRPVELQRAKPSRRLHRGQRDEGAVRAMCRDDGRDVDVADAVAVRAAERFVVEIRAAALDAPTRHGVDSRVDERDSPRLGFTAMHAHLVA